MIKIYSTSWCPSCVTAKQLLDQKGLTYEEINIEKIDMSREQLAEITGGMTVPQIVVNGTNIGGFDKLMILSQSGELEELLND
ncbi:glutaredoxin family protein [Candidatus Marinimicrobia bacterium]|nr:glutaredoxin family protein [Candidatus Neomarinimicrobiota bacterium]MDB3868511.1 glutaredoxin family protein [Candidatus Neomarinimicrobiota bacterium]